MKNESEKRVFSYSHWLIVISTVLCLYYGLNFSYPIWDGEFYFVDSASTVYSAFLPDSWLLARVLGMIPFLGILALQWFGFAKLFGVKRQWQSLFILLTCPGVFLMTNFLTLDAWVFLFQSLAFFSAIYFYFKRDKVSVYIAIISALVVCYIFPFHGVALLAGFLALYLLFLDKKWVWIALSIVCAALFVLDFYLLKTPNGILDDQSQFGSFRPWLLLVVGLGLWVPFWVAGLLDLNLKVGKGDSFSSVIAVGLLVGLAIPSPLFWLVSSVLVAKHLEDLSLPKYPYSKAILYTTILMALLGFVVGIFLVSDFLNWFGGIGFYLGSFIGLLFWGACVISIIILVIEKHQYMQRVLFGFGALFCFALYGITYVTYFEQTAGSQERLMSYLKAENIESVQVDSVYNGGAMHKQLEYRLEKNNINKNKNSNFIVKYQWLAADSLKGFEFLKAPKLDSIRTISPWLKTNK